MARARGLDLDRVYAPTIRPKAGSARSETGLAQGVEPARSKSLGEVQKVRIHAGGVASLSVLAGGSHSELIVLEVKWGGEEGLTVSLEAESCNVVTADTMLSPSFVGAQYGLSWSRTLKNEQHVDLSGPSIPVGPGKSLGKWGRVGAEMTPVASLGNGGRLTRFGAELNIGYFTPELKDDGKKLPRSPGSAGFF